MSPLAPVIPPPNGRVSPIGRIRLIGEIVVTYARARRRLKRADLSSTISELRERRPQRAQGVSDPRALGLRLGRAAARTLSVLPADSRCLMQSLVLSSLLARRGIDSKLILAVRPGEEFAAHAWVEYRGLPLLEPAGDRFGRLVEI